MLLADHQIEDIQGIVQPFVGEKVSDGVISYGLGHYGYDFRIADEWTYIDVSKIDSRDRPVLDPKNLDPNLFTTVKAPYFDVPAGGFVLARTVERWDIPLDCMVLSIGKSTYARLGLILNVTPFEPGWSGYVTLEISNTAPLPSRVYANEGIGQALIFKGKPCRRGYGQGKYQGQGPEVTLARVAPSNNIDSAELRDFDWQGASEEETEEPKKLRARR